MKNMLKTLAVLMIIQVAFAWAAPVSAQEKKEKAKKTEVMKCWASMTCDHCVAKVEKNIPYEKGVTAMEVDLPTKIVTITYRPDKTSPAKLEKALQKLGYKTEIVTEKK